MTPALALFGTGGDKGNVAIEDRRGDGIGGDGESGSGVGQRRLWRVRKAVMLRVA